MKLFRQFQFNWSQLFLFSLFFSLFFVSLSSPVSAAMFRSGETVTLDENDRGLEDLYTAGGTVTIETPVTNDLTVAGGTLNLRGKVTNSLHAAGGTIDIEGQIGNTLRAAGGTIRISSPVTRDMVLAGGNITLTSNATVGKDLVINGGTINIDAPVKGNIWVNGGQVIINNTVGGDVHGDVGQLTLGRNAVIQGNLTYRAREQAELRTGATVQGKTDFKQNVEAKKQQEKAREFITTAALYKLVADILISLLLAYTLGHFLTRLFNDIRTKPFPSVGWGFGFLILMPVLSVMLLILLLLGVFGFVFYAFAIVTAVLLTKLFLGWFIVRWWVRRNSPKTEYIVDWKAALIGPLAMFILAIIPVLGWLLGFILFLLVLGGVVMMLWNLVSRENTPLTSLAKRK